MYGYKRVRIGVMNGSSISIDQKNYLQTMFHWIKNVFSCQAGRSLNIFLLELWIEEGFSTTQSDKSL